MDTSDVKELIASHDVLTSPSKFDGWGAVVNEALHAGLRVIVSENCGSSELLDGETRGEEFQFKGKSNFEEVLLKWVRKGSIKQSERQRIAEWSNDHISGKMAAGYFEQIVEYVYGGKTERPLPPWRN